MDPFRTGADDGSRNSGHPTQEVLAKAFSGDRSAFQEVVERLWRLIFIFVRQRVSDRQRAEDLTQETFLQAWEKRATLREPARAVSWMLAIASRKVIDAHRHASARPESRLPEFFDPIEGHSRSRIGAKAESNLDHKLDGKSEAVQQALAKIPELYRTTLVLRYYSGLTLAQIARLLGTPEGTIRNRLFRAHLTLRAELTAAESAQSSEEPGRKDSS